MAAAAHRDAQSIVQRLLHGLLHLPGVAAQRDI
jgi:hypothetical protein